MSEVATSIDLTQFCNEYQDRYDTMQPFVIDGWRYATDRRICLRVPASGEDNGVGDYPKARELFADFPADDSEWLPWPDRLDARVELSECPRCRGWKTVRKQTPREDKCTFCEGAGEVYLPERIVICAGHEIGFGYAAKIAQLPNPMFSRATFAKSMLAFRFDGGQGLLMHLRAEEA